MEEQFNSTIVQVNIIFLLKYKYLRMLKSDTNSNMKSVDLKLKKIYKQHFQQISWILVH